MELCPRVSGWRALRVPCLVSLHWCVGLGPEPSGEQGHVQGQLWAQGFLRQPVCRWVGLCPHLVSCLAWDFPALVTTDCWARVGLGPGANKLEEEFQMALASTRVHVIEGAPKNGCCQYPCPQGELQLPLDSSGHSPRSTGRSDPGSYQITASTLGPRAYCVHPLKVKCLFPPAFWNSWKKAPLIFKAKCSGSSSSWYRTPVLGSLMSRWDPLLLFSCLWVIHLGVWVLTIPPLHSSYTAHCGSFCISLVVEDLFW